MTIPIGSLASFWVVTKPRIKDTMNDICFETTPQLIGDLFLGGLRTGAGAACSRSVVLYACDAVYGFYLDEDVARDAARVLLRKLWPPGSTLQSSKESLDNKSTDTLD